MGEEKEHSRFTLVTAGGARSRGVAFRSPPRELAPAQERAHDIALRLERNRWNGMVEPRVILRALCPTEPGELEVLGEERPFWDELRALLSPDAAMRPRPARTASSRTAAARALPASPATSSRAARRVLVAVADVPRRRAGLEAVVAGLRRPDADRRPGRPRHRARSSRAGAGHLVALDPPPRGIRDPLLNLAPRAHLAWGPAEAEFAIAAYRTALDLRPQLAGVYRALRELGPDAPPEAVVAAARGGGRYPRPIEVCARLLTVLTELGLIELDLEAPSCRVIEASRPTSSSHPPTGRARPSSTPSSTRSHRSCPTGCRRPRPADPHERSWLGPIRSSVRIVLLMQIGRPP